MWNIYIIECKDGKFYTGVTNNLKRRLMEHNSGNGGRFTRFRKPIKLVYCEECKEKPEALKRESEIKKLNREKKLALVRSFSFSHLVEASGQFLT
ncbi:MAG: GIY-YIG nuclease family protein [Candidatus Omnitrophica bacterium]|nr:GIY-YIG nuclease family protein [Candidatus Omnitrophota bacterium]